MYVQIFNRNHLPDIFQILNVKHLCLRYKSFYGNTKTIFSVRHVLKNVFLNI